jgi:hypothetical protein
MLTILDNAKADTQHDWTLTTRLVAEGYGVSAEVIRSHKANHSDELHRDRHYIMTGKNTSWTKAGVIRLGMFIQSPSAAAFRDAAENLILATTAKPSLVSTVDHFNALPSSIVELDLLADAIADEVLANELKDRVNQSLERKRNDRTSLDAALGKLGLPIPRSWINAA